MPQTGQILHTYLQLSFSLEVADTGANEAYILAEMFLVMAAYNPLVYKRNKVLKGVCNQVVDSLASEEYIFSLELGLSGLEVVLRGSLLRSLLLRAYLVRIIKHLLYLLLVSAFQFL